jgi:Na+-transporting NADH:ubiquinone oxidoreductase subunit NqrB
MRLRQLLLLVPLFLVVALPAKADQDSVWVSGSYSTLNNGYGIGPYGGTLNGAPTQFYCVDFNDEIKGNTGWQANVTSLTSSSFSQTLKGNQTYYLEAAWLISKMMMNPNNSKLDAQLQWAIWYLSLGKTDTSFTDYSTDVSWDQQALAAVNSGNLGFSVSGWEILTPTPLGAYGQEFIVPGPGAATPEPRTIVLLLAGLAAFLVLARKK